MTRNCSSLFSQSRVLEIKQCAIVRFRILNNLVTKTDSRVFISNSIVFMLEILIEFILIFELFNSYVWSFDFDQKTIPQILLITEKFIQILIYGIRDLI